MFVQSKIFCTDENEADTEKWQPEGGHNRASGHGQPLSKYEAGGPGYGL